MIKAEEIKKINPKEYQYLTMDKDGLIRAWDKKPFTSIYHEWWSENNDGRFSNRIGYIEVEEFKGKSWKNCLIEFEPDYSNMIGCVGWFEDCQGEKMLGILDNFDKEDILPFHRENGGNWGIFRPAKPNELKFYEE